MIPEKIIVNDQIYISQLLMSDAKKIAFCCNDTQITQWTSEIPYPYSERDAIEFLSFILDEKNDSGLQWAIRNENGELLGIVGFKDIEGGHKAEIGYWLANPYWGKGIMSKVVKAACDFGFENLKLIRIYARVFCPNEASSRVLEKCGFLCEGLARKAEMKDEKIFDSKLYALVVG